VMEEVIDGVPALAGAMASDEDGDGDDEGVEADGSADGVTAGKLSVAGASDEPATCSVLLVVDAACVDVSGRVSSILVFGIDDFAVTEDVEGRILTAVESEAVAC